MTPFIRLVIFVWIAASFVFEAAAKAISQHNIPDAFICKGKGEIPVSDAQQFLNSGEVLVKKIEDFTQSGMNAVTLYYSEGGISFGDLRIHSIGALSGEHMDEFSWRGLFNEEDQQGEKLKKFLEKVLGKGFVRFNLGPETGLGPEVDLEIASLVSQSSILTLTWLPADAIFIDKLSAVAIKAGEGGDAIGRPMKYVVELENGHFLVTCVYR